MSPNSRKHGADRKGRSAKAAATPQGRSPLTPFYIVLGLVALAGIAILVTQFTGQEAPATEPVPIAIDSLELSQVEGVAIGSEDAPVVVYEFADFQCPHCAQFATFVAPVVKERLVEPGIVRYVYYDFPLGGAFQHSFLAARAARCAREQDRFWEYHDMLYGRQPTWSVSDDPTDLFIDYAGQLGLNGDAFEECLRSDRYARVISENRALGETLGVSGTPAIFVNGMRLPTVPSYEDLERIVLEEAGAAAATDSTTAPTDTSAAEEDAGS